MIALPSLAREVASPRYAHFGEPGRSHSGLHVFLAGRERCLPGYRVQRRGFRGYGVEFVSEGGGQVVLDGKSFPLFAGVLFCYGPGTEQDIAADPARPPVKYFADFTGTGALRTLRRNGLLPGMAVQVIEVEPLRYFFEQLINQNDLDPDAALENASLCLNLILLRARRASEPLNPVIGSATFSQWRAHIDEHFLRIKTLEQMAKELRTRPSRICRVFQQFGLPRPYFYLTRKKLNRAVELLVGEHCSVQEAGRAVGYEDPYHFSRLFKQHFGRSPSKFLKLADRAGDPVHDCRSGLMAF